MKYFFMTALAGTGLLFMTMPAQAQQTGPEYSYHQNQYQREATSHDRLFDQMRDDLSLASTTATPFSGDRDRVAIARDQLDQLQHVVDTGEYDGLTFSQTISAMQRVVDLNRMTDRNRDYLVNDIGQLRNLEAQLGG